ncbi:hypothetical protein BJY04DRAFT_216242 [Aspergillus karnatakaensis]|uniref:DUF3716 domain-containing protein n=1 Tax=Aspergillus karnatakaensis TaxID=1810916 RepID=UPI003CCDDDE2
MPWLWDMMASFTAINKPKTRAPSVSNRPEPSRPPDNRRPQLAAKSNNDGSPPNRLVPSDSGQKQSNKGNKDAQVEKPDAKACGAVRKTRQTRPERQFTQPKGRTTRQSMTKSRCALRKPETEDTRKSKPKQKRHTPVQKEDDPIKELPNLSATDLPIPPSGKTNLVVDYYTSHPVLRHLDWRIGKNGLLKRRGLSDPDSYTAAFTQTRGQVAETPCMRCAQDKGPWESCVVDDITVLDGVCGNCRVAKEWGCKYRNRGQPLEASTNSDNEEVGRKRRRRGTDTKQDDSKPLAPPKRKRKRTSPTVTEEPASCSIANPPTQQDQETAQVVPNPPLDPTPNTNTNLISDKAEGGAENGSEDPGPFSSTLDDIDDIRCLEGALAELIAYIHGIQERLTYLRGRPAITNENQPSARSEQFQAQS